MASTSHNNKFPKILFGFQFSYWLKKYYCARTDALQRWLTSMIYINKGRVNRFHKEDYSVQKRVTIFLFWVLPITTIKYSNLKSNLFYNSMSYISFILILIYFYGKTHGNVEQVFILYVPHQTGCLKNLHLILRLNFGAVHFLISKMSVLPDPRDMYKSFGTSNVSFYILMN